MPLQTATDDEDAMLHHCDAWSGTLTTVESETALLAKLAGADIMGSIEQGNLDCKSPTVLDADTGVALTGLALAQPATPEKAYDQWRTWHSYCDGTLVLHGHNDSCCEVQHLFGARPDVMRTLRKSTKSSLLGTLHISAGRDFATRHCMDD